ncbi:uncharacterized protein LOC123030333 [Varanus komodoensis]|uniref:uncharacterized protein LOC123030333 n=1 Tax=Varanus komodoensis TaxID=61221 RepID=UPI001CF79051|nr:uncharacterized protein LOC123030333 [Varanus komodoensis]
METLDEFDNEYPLTVSFCEQISPQAFDQQALSYTKKSLQELYAQMEQNPGICKRVLRKRKQSENEKAGLVRFLKAKLFYMLQGDMNSDNVLGELELEEKVEQLRQEMEKASDYACAAKTALWRPLEVQMGKTAPLGGFSPSQNKLLDSGVPAMPRIFGSFPKQVERSPASGADLKQLWAGLASANRKSLVDLRPFVLNPGGFRPSFLGSNISRLKYSSFPRSPASGPAPSSHSAGSPGTTAVFNTPVLPKFKGDKDEEKESETAGPESKPTGA